MSHDAKVQDEPSLVRRGANPAVITNTDQSGYDAFMARRANAQRQVEVHNKVEQLETEVSSLNQKLDAILRILGNRTHVDG